MFCELMFKIFVSVKENLSFYEKKPFFFTVVG